MHGHLEISSVSMEKNEAGVLESVVAGGPLLVYLVWRKSWYLSNVGIILSLQ